MIPRDLTSQLWDQGSALLAFYDDARLWIKRRVDHVEFDDDVVFRTQTTLDIELSPEDAARLPRWRGRYLLPIHQLRRDREIDITVHDAEGTPLPQLTRRDERSLVAAGLVSKYEDTALAGPVEIYQAIVSAIEPLATLEASDLGDALREERRTYEQQRLVIAAVDLGDDVDEEIDRESSDPDDVERGWMFRIVITRSQVRPPTRTSFWRAGGLTAAYGTRQGALARQFSGPQPDDPLVRDDDVIRVPVKQLDACESYHLEFQAPDGVMVKEAKLQGTVGTLENFTTIFKNWPDQAPDEDALDSVKFRCDNDEIHVDKAHLFYSSDLARPDARLFGASAIIVVRPMTSGYTRAGVIASFLASAVLVALLFTIGWRGRVNSWNDWKPESQAIVAMLLLGPTLLAAVIVRDNEHQMSKRILWGYRVRVGLQGITTFAAAFLYAAGVPDTPRWEVLGLLTVSSLILTDRTYRSYRVSRRLLRARTLQPSSVP